MRATRRSRPAVLRRQLGTYLDRIWWIVRDAMRMYWPQTLVVTLINLVGIGAGAVTVAGFVVYAKAVEEGHKTVHLKWFDIEISDGALAFYRFAGVIALLGLISAALLYLAQWRISRITAAYQNACSKRLFSLAADPACAGWQLTMGDSLRRSLGRLNGMSVRLTAFALRNMLRVILPVCTFCVAVGVILWVDPILTLILLPVMLAYLLPLYGINRGVARQHRRYTESQPEARESINAALAVSLDSNAPFADRERRIEALFDQPIHAHVANLFWKRKLSDARMQWVNTSFFVLCLTTIFVFFGVATQTSGRTWAEFLGYVVALQFAMMSVRQTTSRFVKLSRFLPEYQAYTEFVDEAERRRRERLAAPEAATLPDTIVLRCGKGMWNGEPRVRMQFHSPIVLLANQRPSMAECYGLASALEAHARDEVDFIRGLFVVPERSIDDSEDFFHHVHESRLTMINARVIHSADELFVERFTGALADSRIAIVSDDPLRMASETWEPILSGDVPVVVFEDREVIAAGDVEWMRRHAQSIAEHFGIRSDDDADESELEDAELEDDDE